MGDIKFDFTAIDNRTSPLLDKKYVRLIVTAICSNSDFMVMGDAVDFIVGYAKHKGLDVIQVDIDGIDVLRGEAVIHTESNPPYSNCHVSWADYLAENPDKQHLLLFFVDKADERVINALKSIIEAHKIQDKKYDNYFVGVICRDENRQINSTINPLVRFIKISD